MTYDDDIPEDQANIPTTLKTDVPDPTKRYYRNPVTGRFTSKNPLKTKKGRKIFLGLIQQNGGNAAAACRAMLITRRQLEYYCNRNPDFKKLVEQERGIGAEKHTEYMESGLRTAEQILVNLLTDAKLNAEDLSAKDVVDIFKALKPKVKKVEKTTYSQHNTLNLNNLSPDELSKLLEMQEKASIAPTFDALPEPQTEAA